MGTWSLGSGASQMHEHQERRKGDICNHWKEVPGMDDGLHLQLRKVVSAGLRGHGGAWKHPWAWSRSLCACDLEIGIVRALEGVRSKEGVIEWERLMISRLVVKTLFCVH